LSWTLPITSRGSSDTLKDIPGKNREANAMGVGVIVQNTLFARTARRFSTFTREIDPPGGSDRANHAKTTQKGWAKMGWV